MNEFDPHGPMPDPAGNREAWLRWRRHGIGGSDAMAVLGRDPFGRTPLDVYFDKRGSIDAPRQETGRMRRGRAMEQHVVDEFCRVTGCAVSQQPAIPSADFPWMRCSVDRMIEAGAGAIGGKPVDRRGVLEAKSCNPGFFAKVVRDGPPEGWIIEANHNMIVWEVDWLCIVAMETDDWDRLRLWPIEQDEALSVAIVEAERDFWQNHVVANVPPPIDPKVAAQAEVPPGELVHVDDDAELTALAQTWLDLDAAAKDASDAASIAKDRLKNLLGEKTAVQFGPHRLLFRQQGGNPRPDAKLCLTWITETFSALNRELETTGPVALADAFRGYLLRLQDREFVTSALYKPSAVSRPLRHFIINP